MHIATYVYIHLINIEYTDDLIKKVLEFCMNEHDKPTLPTSPSPLASKYEHPDKETIPLFSRCKH